MVTEEICQEIVSRMHGQTCTVTRTVSPGGANESSSSVIHEHAVSRRDLYDELLLRFDIRDIDDAISWLKVRDFLTSFGFGLSAPEMGYELTEKGIAYGTSKQMDDADLRRLSSKVLSVKPSMYGISLNLKEAWWRIRKRRK
jgi:hypothetical protein